MIIQTGGNQATRILEVCKRRGVTIFVEDGKLGYKPQARMTRGLLDDIQRNKEQVLALLDGRLMEPEPAEQTSLSDQSGVPERGPDELYKLLTSLVIRGFEFRLEGTSEEPRVLVRPVLDLTSEEMALLKENHSHTIAWIRDVAIVRGPRRRLRAGVWRWLDKDADSREWVLKFWDEPERGQCYVRGQLWQVIAELNELGVKVRKEEQREVLPFVVMEVAAEIANERGAA